MSSFPASMGAKIRKKIRRLSQKLRGRINSRMLMFPAFMAPEPYLGLLSYLFFQLPGMRFGNFPFAGGCGIFKKRFGKNFVIAPPGSSYGNIHYRVVGFTRDPFRSPENGGILV